MAIKNLSLLIFATIATVAALLAVLTMMLVYSNDALFESAQSRYESYLLADELRQISDKLTRTARTYSMTGGVQFEKRYWDILSIRNGKQQRLDGRTLPLRRLMQDAGFTAAEFSLLDEPQRNSNALVAREEMAFDLVKQGGEVNMATARTLMHDPIYHSEKEKIMDPIDRFLTLLNNRTRNEVLANKQQSAACCLQSKSLLVH